MLNINDNGIQASGEVGYEADGFTRDQFLEALGQMKGQDFVLTLHSPGGDVFQGQSIHNHLAAYPGTIQCVLDSLVASIATVMMCGADEILAFKATKVMIHNPFTLMIGDASEFRHTADVLDKLANDAAEVYAEKSGRDPSYWRELMDAETYFTASEALEVGLIDGIIDQKCKPKQKAERPVAGASAVVATPRLDAVRAMQGHRQKRAAAIYRHR